MTENVILIQGAGIGGIALARELERLGRNWIIVERAPRISPVGAGITLASNALKCLQRTIEIDDLRERGRTLRFMHVQNAKGQTLSTLDTKLPDDPFFGVAIHRHELHAALLEGLSPERILLGRSIVDINDDGGIIAKLSDGTRIEADYLVGADGIRSEIRRKMFGASAIKYSGEVAWRTVVSHSLTPGDESVEAWGHGKRLGYIQVSPNKVYIYVTLKMSQEAYEAGATQLSREQLRQCLQEFRGRARVIVEKFCDAPEIIHNDLEELDTHYWTKGRTILIGDAAHAITANLGQGAAMAIEDAYILGSLWERDHSPGALKKFEMARKERVSFVGNESRKVGRFAQWKSAPAVSLRNLLMANVPKAHQRQLQKRLFAGVME